MRYRAATVKTRVFVVRFNFLIEAQDLGAVSPASGDFSKVRYACSSRFLIVLSTSTSFL